MLRKLQEGRECFLKHSSNPDLTDFQALLVGPVGPLGGGGVGGRFSFPVLHGAHRLNVEIYARQTFQLSS